MKLTRSPQGFILQADSGVFWGPLRIGLMWVGFDLVVLAMGLLAIAPGRLDLLGWDLWPWLGQAALGRGGWLGSSVVLLLGLGLWRWFRRMYRSLSQLRPWQARFEHRTDTIMLHQRSYLGAHAHLSLPRLAVAALELVYACAPEDSADPDEGSCFVNLHLRSPHPSPLKLTPSPLAWGVAMALAQQLRQYLDLPSTPAYVGISAWRGAEDTRSRILEQSGDRLVYRLSYAHVVVWIYLFSAGWALGAASLIFFIVHSFFALFLWANALALLLAALPWVGLLWLMQKVGFSETWAFERTAHQFQLKRRGIWGSRIQAFSSQAVRQVTVTTAMGSPQSQTTYEVQLKAPGVDLGQGKGLTQTGQAQTGRVIYSNRSLAEAQVFANTLRHYLNLPPQLE